jgi:MFS superfamily sulfate permease-like transporter
MAPAEWGRSDMMMAMFTVWVVFAGGALLGLIIGALLALAFVAMRRELLRAERAPGSFS